MRETNISRTYHFPPLQFVYSRRVEFFMKHETDETKEINFVSRSVPQTKWNRVPLTVSLPKHNEIFCLFNFVSHETERRNGKMGNR
jgi:hypothetical protein